MSGLKDLSDNIKKVYDSDSENISQILNLLLGKACRYNRIGSYFTSKSFVSLAEGLSKFIVKSGKMRLIINYEMEREDYAEIKKNLSGRLMDILRSTDDPRVKGDGKTFDLPPYVLNSRQ